MRVYLDCFSGISGDMYLGSLVDMGADLSELMSFLEPFKIPGLALSASRVVKHGIEATFVQVDVNEHDHHDESHGHKHHHHHGKTFNDITHYLRHQQIPEDLRLRAESVFRRIAEAESIVHGKPLEELHFHEVGAWDAVVDVVGVLWCLRKLGIDEVLCSSVNVGGGFVEFSHGRYPVPAPATLNILKAAQIPFYTTPEVGELLTPTGAALLAETVTNFTSPGVMTAGRIAYGAGKRQTGTTPNVVRMTAFESGSSKSDQVAVIETNIDDMNPEFCELALERLFEAGALDAFITPVIMKKSRPGYQITVIAPAGMESVMAKILLCETTTFGVRWNYMERKILDREVKIVETLYGPIQVKFGTGAASKAVPEYKDCLEAARRHGVPIQSVYQAASK